MNWYTRFLGLAEHVSSWSKDPSTKVGAVIADDKNRVISLGYNGFPRGMADTKARYEDREEKLARMIHAEINAMDNASRSVEGCTMYVWPFIACHECAVQVINKGIIEVIAPTPSELQAERWGASFTKSEEYFEECGVKFRYIDP